MYTYIYICVYICIYIYAYLHIRNIEMYICKIWKPRNLYMKTNMYSLLHLECHLILFSNLNLFGLFATERGKRDVENYIIN